MNKKNLSVVMAGAMLATSVAPVLAEATKENTYEVALGNTGLLIDQLEKLFESKKYDKTDDLAGQSVYELQKKDTTEWEKISLEDLKTLANKGPVADYELKVVEKAYANVDGKIFSKEPKRYTAERLEELGTNFNDEVEGTPIAQLKEKKVMEKLEYNKEAKTVTITLANNENFENKKIVLKEKDFELDFAKPIDKDGNVIPMENIGDDKAVKPAEIVGFKTQDPSVAIEGEKDLYYINLVKGDVKHTVNSEDLYDGLMLTTDGHTLLRTVNAYKADSKKTVKIENENVKPNGSISSFDVVLTDANKNTTIVTVKGTNKGRIETLIKWLKAGKADVDILAGSNRYATAVEIAKTFVQNIYNASNSTDLVLVNGEALVDGLAAAPYAKTLNNGWGAPILLTADNKLPKETKDFMKELVGSNQVSNPGTVTIIGGEAVVSQNVVNELKDIGFKVKRISGDNREETSLAVAQKLNSSKKAYVIGAEGEADAMSISPVAAKERTPIIVSKSAKGLSTVGINALSDYNEVEIIGGTNAVSSEDEAKIKELVSNEDNVTRIAGKNRFETNANIIKAKYSAGFNKVLVTNDGRVDKTKLVDALPVSIFASNNWDTNPAPIVLASKDLTKDQLNQVVLHADKSGTTLYQVGGTVERTVMQTLADKLGLSR